MKVNDARLLNLEKEFGTRRQKELERLPVLSTDDEVVVQSIVNAYENELRTRVIRNESPGLQKEIESLGERYEPKLQAVYQ